MGTFISYNKPSTGSGGGGGIHALVTPYKGLAIGLALNTANHNGTASYGTNTLQLFPFIPANTFDIDQILLPVATAVAGGQATISIYSDLNGKPDTRLYRSATIDCSTTGNKILTMSFSFTAGTTYWLGITQNNGSINFNAVSFNWSYHFAWLNNTGSTISANCFSYSPTTSPGTEPAALIAASLALNFANIPSYSLRVN